MPALCGPIMNDALRCADEARMVQVPVGDEDQAILLRSVGDKAALGFAPKDHLALGERLGLIDFEAGARVSGAKQARSAPTVFCSTCVCNVMVLVEPSLSIRSEG